MCPVYERAGGHAYGSVYPGPIGAILSPLLTGVEDNASLPYASSLCGACYDVCPVKINIPEILVHLRAEHVEEQAAGRRTPTAEAALMRTVSWVMRDPKRWSLALRSGRLGRLLGRRRGVIGDVPAPVVGQWTGDPGPAATAAVDVPRLVGPRARRRRSTGVERRAAAQTP